MQAADIMSRTVVTVQPAAPIIEAIRLMLGQKISGIPVVDDPGNLVGILTEGDLLRRVETGTERKRSRWMDLIRGPGRQAGDYVHTHGRKVEEVMTRNVISVSPQSSLEEIVGIMESKHVKRVPVLLNDRLVGLVSRADLLRALADILEGNTAAAAATDADLRAQVLAEFSRRDWGQRGQVTVTVFDGVVSLEGVVYGTQEQQAMRVAAENVAGVKEVRDHLDYINPNVGLRGM